MIAYVSGCRRRRRLFLAVLLLAFVGCQVDSSPLPDSAGDVEPSFAEQAAAVRRGDSDVIRLDRTLVRDADLAALDDVRDRVRRINLSHTEITDQGLAKVAQCRDLEQLRLAGPQITDEGMAEVARLAKLRFLHLLDAPITDAGLDQLHALSSLESLYLDRTHVSDEGLARLLQALPNVHLHIDDHHHPLDVRDDHSH